jgi:hypothetical protein
MTRGREGAAAAVVPEILFEKHWTERILSEGILNLDVYVQMHLLWLKY